MTYSYTASRQRSGLSLQQPNASAWTLTYGRDAANRINAVTSPAGAFGYEYAGGADPGVASVAALIKRLTLPNSAVITNQFDAEARLLGTVLRNGSGTLLNQHLYSYNDLDQRTNQTRTDGDFVAYGYDAQSQLVSAIGKSQVH